jgi:hypothetical protein
MKEKSKYQFNSKKELDNFLAIARFPNQEAINKYVAEQTNPAWEKPIINENKAIVHKGFGMTKEMNDAQVKADSELAQQQKADNEMSVQMENKSTPKGMNPILKKSLIALGVIGAVIGGYLLIKKNKK